MIGRPAARVESRASRTPVALVTPTSGVMVAGPVALRNKGTNGTGCPLTLAVWIERVRLDPGRSGPGDGSSEKRTWMAGVTCMLEPAVRRIQRA